MRQLDAPLFSLLVLTDLFFIGVLAAPGLYYRVRIPAFIAIALVQFYFAFRTTTGTATGDHAIADAYMCRLFIASDFLYLTDVQRDLWPIGKPKFSERESAWGRFKWAFVLVYSSRGIGWNSEARHATPKTPSSSTRLGFVARQIRRVVVAFLVLDVTGVFVRRWNAFHLGGSFTDDGLLWQSAYTAIWYTSACAGLILPHAVVAGIAVGVGLSDPGDWPNLFGGAGYTYTLRKFWGRYWHQFLRRFLTTHAKAAARLLHLQPRKILTTYVELFIVFLISGFIHMVGSYTVVHDLRDASETCLFFILQAAVITLEDGIIHLGKHLGIRDGIAVRAVGYVWTWGWLVLLTPIWLNKMMRVGLLDPGSEPMLSISEGVGRGQWFPTVQTSISSR